VHEQLRDRKKRKQESFHKYLLQMKQISSLGNIDARSVIRYVVDGLNMRSDFRYSLYSCKSNKELQEQYEVFDREPEEAARFQRQEESLLQLWVISARIASLP